MIMTKRRGEGSRGTGEGKRSREKKREKEEREGEEGTEEQKEEKYLSAKEEEVIGSTRYFRVLTFSL